jgi:methyl-accepting chemotaxis protein
MKQRVGFMRRYSIRTRLIGTLVVMMVLVCLVSAVGILSMAKQSQNTDQFITRSLERSHALSDVNRVVGDINRAEKDMIIYYDDRITLNKHRDQWTASVASAKGLLESMRTTANDKEAPLLDEAITSLGAYAEATLNIVLQVEDGAYDNATTADKMLGKAKGHMQKLDEALLNTAKVLDADATDARSDREQGMVEATLLNLGVLGLVALLLVPFTWINIRSICKPLERTRELVTAIAGGDLTRVVEVEGKDETALMMEALRSMQTSLQQMMGQVRSATDSINTASQEIASGNQDLSARTEQAASNLEETAASMEELTSTVRQSADAARQANQLASSAAEIAARGGQVVGQVVTTMDEINHSSKKISDIIGVIDGIAFQTNILALNAAVEAARAGEQGRGFAVVAGEVRNLAQRSAEAAKEIKGLIGASVDKVEAGSRLVADAGQTMSEIVGSVQRVSDIIGEITAAAGEQSDGIGQVNVAVTQLDQMTQQNAALVEQSAAAAESLKDQASRLAQVIQIFRTDDTGVPAGVR